eukprot:2162841-Amphidinium_carterae.1
MALPSLFSYRILSLLASRVAGLQGRINRARGGILQRDGLERQVVHALQSCGRGQTCAAFGACKFSRCKWQTIQASSP